MALCPGQRRPRGPWGLVCHPRSARRPRSTRFRLTHQPARASVLANVGFPLVFRPWMGLSVPGSAVPGATTSVSWPLPATLSFQLPIGFLSGGSSLVFSASRSAIL